MTPTRELIENREIVEGQHYDFKREVKFEKSESGRIAKEKFINDVVAFLNSGGGHLIVGVDDRKTGEFQSYSPMSGNRDAIQRQWLQVIQDNIEPVPNKVSIGFIDIDGGFLVDIRIPPHAMQPYMNRLTGGFYERTGSVNRPLRREEIKARFVPFKEMETELARRFDEGAKSLVMDALRENLRSGISIDPFRQFPPPPVRGSIFQYGILPRQHYEDRPPYDTSRQSRMAITSFDGGIVASGLRGDGEGFAFTKSKGDLKFERLFVSTDWYVSGFCRRALHINRGGRVNLEEFGARVRNYLRFLQSFLAEENGIEGPFAVLLAADDLDDDHLEDAFRSSSVRFSRPRIVEEVNDEAMIRDFLEMVRSASIHD